jgi:CubicO group peptidase (beta-lactamase class C family)
MSFQLTRRSMIRKLAGTLAAGWAAFPAYEAFASQLPGSQTTGAERGQLNRLMWQFNRRFTVPSLSLAISRNAAFVYDRAIGMADHEKAIQAEQSSLFRIASVTKPITSVAIFSLIEQRKINLGDKVFGPSGILGTKYGKGPYKQYVTDVTVDHLLTHTSGGWPNDDTDPMFQHNGWDHEKLISWTIENLPLTYPPGQHWAYSNFGYCVLGRVIEQVTGQTYESYVQSVILAPCGISDMAIARDKEGQRFPNEVIYYGQYSEDPYKINVTRMDSHGGWVATPMDLVQFLNHVSGFSGTPGLLKPATIATMTTPTPAYPQSSPVSYARGWNVRTDAPGTWWHNGSLPGSTTIMVRTNTGMCWAALTNTRTEPHDQMDAALDQLMWNLVLSVPAWSS